MVQIIPAARSKYSFGDESGKSFSKGFGDSFEDAFSQGMEEKSYSSSKQRKMKL